MRNIREINGGLRTDYDIDKYSPTDNNLCELFSVLGYDITRRCKDLFFTNFALGYRSEGYSGNLNHKWIAADASYFARLVNIIEPTVMICLGRATFEGVQIACIGKNGGSEAITALWKASKIPSSFPCNRGKLPPPLLWRIAARSEP